MQGKKLLLLLTCSIMTMANHDTYNGPACSPKVIVSPTISPNIKNQIIISLKLSQITQVIIRWKDAIGDHCTAVKNRTFGFFEQSKDLAVDHRYKLLAATLAGISGYFVYQVLCGNSYLARDNLWSSWKKETSMEELLTIPHQNLAHQLMLEIQGRYVSVSDPADFLTPMVDFMNSVEKELSQLRSYNRLYQWSSKIYLEKILPFNTNLFDGIKEKTQRLLYLKNGFASWVAQYKMLNALKKSKMIRRSRRKCVPLRLNQGLTAST